MRKISHRAGFGFGRYGLKLLLLGSAVSLGWTPPSHAQSSGAHYDAPYYYMVADGTGHSETFDFDSLDDAIASAKTYFAAAYPSNPQACVVESKYLDDAQSISAGDVAKVDYAPSTDPSIACSGASVTIQWTRYDNDPGKNTGDAGNCNGGNGTEGGDIKIVCPSTPMVADPINFATGNKYEQDTDFSGSPWLTFRRFYNSQATIGRSTLGPQWRHSFDRSLAFLNTLADGTGTPYIKLYRPDGRYERFQPGNGGWVADADVADTLTEQRDDSGHLIGYRVFMATPQQFEFYSTAGLLQSITDESGQVASFTYSADRLQTVTDPYGRTLQFTYDGSGRLQTVTQPDGGVLTYEYSNGNLASVQYPDGYTRHYVYNEQSLTSGLSFPNALTGVIDENGVRFESTGYDSSGLAISSSHAGGADATTLTNDASGATLTTPLGGSIDLGREDDGFGALKFDFSSSFCHTAGCNQPWLRVIYDSNGWPARFDPFNGVATDTTYDSVGLETQRAIPLIWVCPGNAPSTPPGTPSCVIRSHA